MFNLGGNDLCANDATHAEAFLAAFDEAGHHIWSRSFGGAQDDSGEGVLLDPSYDVVVAGWFDGESLGECQAHRRWAPRCVCRRILTVD